MANNAVRPNLDRVRKQAKTLLRRYRQHKPEALGAFREFLPAAAGKSDDEIIALDLRLHDAQSCLARKLGFTSWNNLRLFVQWRDSPEMELARARGQWLALVFGDGNRTRQPELVARMLEEKPELARGEDFLCCITGDEQTLTRLLEENPGFAHGPEPAGAPNGLPPEMPKPARGRLQRKRLIMRPPLVALTHSAFLALPRYRERMRRCARMLLDAGADPNQSWEHPEGFTLSALYGAAGLSHDTELTRALLEAGADPNDGESLYHSLDACDLGCTKLLIDAGAAVRGTVLFHVLDREDPAGLKLLLKHCNDVNIDSDTMGTPLHWAIRRRRSSEHIRLLLDAGADVRRPRKDGVQACRLAELHGLPEIAALLRKHGASAELSPQDRFVAACARGDRKLAQGLLEDDPELIGKLDETQLGVLPELAEQGVEEAVRLMVELGWPVRTRGGMWEASAINNAVFQGNAELTRFLLAHGASWEEEQAYGGNVLGTLSWASRFVTGESLADADWLGCAEALIEAGMPVPGPRGRFPPELAEYFSELRNVR